MQIKTTSMNGSFEVLDEKDRALLSLKYTNSLTGKAKALLQSGELEIRSKNFWRSRFEILKNKNIYGEITANWKGNVIIQLNDASLRTQKYILRCAGFLGNRFELMTENGEKILTLHTHFNWKKLSYNYTIELGKAKKETQDIVELLLYAGFGINLYMAMIGG